MRKLIVAFIILTVLLSTSAVALKPKENSITASVPVGGNTYVSGKAYSVAPNSMVTLRNMENGAAKTINADKYGRFVSAIPAHIGDEIRAEFEGGDMAVENLPDFGFGEAVWLGYTIGMAYAEGVSRPMISDDGEINFEKLLGPLASAIFIGKEITE